MASDDIITLAQAFDKSDLAFCVIKVLLDADGKPYDWEFVYLNDELARLEGKTKEQLLHKHFFEVFPEGNAKWFEYYYPAAYEGKSCAFKDISEEIGRYLKIHCFPVAHGYCGCILEDIKELEESLRREHEGDALIRGLAKNYSAVWLIEAPRMTMHLYQTEGHYVIAEPILKDLTTDTYREGIERYISKYVLPEERERVLRETALERVIEGTRTADTYTVNYRRYYQQQIDYYQISYAAVKGTDSFVMGFLNVNDIVREQQKQALALQQALEAAQRANAAKTIFLSNMSHDIRTPMNAIIGFTNLALSHIGDPTQVLGYLRKIDASGNHLLSLINDVLDMSRIESGKLQLEEVPCSLFEILTNLQNIMMADISAKGQRFAVEMADMQHEHVICDKLRLNQVLLNVVSNAVKFTPNGGCINVKLSEKSGTNGINEYEFRIKDNGIGMNDTFCEHIFEPFERERNSTVSGIQGTGLGMAICKSIVDMMNGTISVHSKQNVGTEFIITLPMRENDARPMPKQTSAKPIVAGKRLLLVEDNELNREIATAILNDHGFQVEEAQNGLLAIDQLERKGPGYYDMVLMDVQMPVMDGYEATKRIRAMEDRMLARLPIIAMTANAFDEDKQRAIDAGMDAYVAKPIHVATLMHTIHGLIETEHPNMAY